MASYSQPSYQQPYYGTPYQQAPPAPMMGGGYYGAPQGYPMPQAPVYQMDAASFRREFTTRLAELNVNSRPLIQGLSALAHDHVRYGDIAAQCLEAHIRRVPPWMKLPAWYLLDAISKNLYDPYARHFAAFVTPLFLESYGQVDEGTRSKMVEMLLTWRTGAPGGQQLFGVANQIAIERGIWGDGNTHTNASAPGPSRLSKTQVLSELEFALGQKERALQSNPYDTTSQTHVAVLTQLRKLVEAGVSQDELQQILTQLRALVRPPTAPPAPAPVPTPPVHVPTPQPQWSAPTPQPAAPTYNAPGPSNYARQAQPPPYPQPMQDVKPSISAPPATGAAPLPAFDIHNMLSSLVKAGIVTATATPVNGLGDQQQTDEGMEKEESRSYRRTILRQKVKLNSAELSRTKPPVVDILYDKLPVQCKQCGRRFGESAQGRKDYQSHLDMHFRQNRKATQDLGRGHSRSWFVDFEDWVHDVAGDVKGKRRADATKDEAAEEEAKRHAELAAQFVVIPPGEEALPMPCPICKEHLKSEFLEDEEEWVWRNAVRKEDKLYHATCYAEAASSKTKSSLVSRLVNESRRSSTPELSGKRRTPSPVPDAKPVAGVKRKVEEEDDMHLLRAQLENSPPSKKVALAAS
ncbi:uncharacterized protein SCHCODRAFT_02621902 [Schizophyllum commune H4-8]|nr:uncharacterized protein SCHCODRAFT_02621902 [Schizophyllum commune H4-8]KAI5893471.1 hypothetical protein SCHCODRAFT_02621902 [Schizophyllum commune H4-8]